MHRAANYRLGIVSTYLPRRCGLATYTADLHEALGLATGDIDPVVVAIDRDGLSYGDEVVATINQDRISDYEDAAETIRRVGVDAVLIQHEYGIFGGPSGAYVLHLARALTGCGIPYLVTLHTLLSQPSAGQAATLSTLCSGAAGVTVFTETARRIAIRTGIASRHQITIVPHGAPEILRHAPGPEELRPDVAEVLDQLADDVPVLTTFGLVSVGKGLEDSIEALAGVVTRHPATRYVIAGATHPEIVRNEGETYREGLHRLVHRLGLTRNVLFIDSFLSPAELAVLLNRTTIFITPYRSAEQICSGALTFAVAAGCPVVSTSYRYAEDLLANGAGLLAPCRDVAALTQGINALLDDPARLAAARAVADAQGARLVWPAVALTAGQLIRDVVNEARTGAGGGLPPAVLAAPPLRLNHLIKLVDELGIIEFCKGEEPDHAYGYNVDDVSRLGIVAAELLAAGRCGEVVRPWTWLVVRFLRAAYQRDGRMYNRMTYGGAWTDEPYLGDHVGRSVWALGMLIVTPAVPADVRNAAARLLDELAPHTPALAGLGLRSAAYAMLGLARAEQTAPELTEIVHRLDATLRKNADSDWYWFEPILTYDNARLPQALLVGASVIGDRAIAHHALTALNWYTAHVGLTAGLLRNVGNRWHHRDQDESAWQDDGDEQPIDTASTVEALVEAWRYTGDPRYASLAGTAYAWFLGRNRHGAPLYDDQTGACHDGLTSSGVNTNRGAESALAHHQAMLSLVRSGLATFRERTPDRRPGASRVNRDRQPTGPVSRDRMNAERIPADTERTDRTERAAMVGPDWAGTVRTPDRAGQSHGARPTGPGTGGAAIPATPPARPTVATPPPARPIRPKHRSRKTEGHNDAR